MGACYVQMWNEWRCVSLEKHYQLRVQSKKVRGTYISVEVYVSLEHTGHGSRMYISELRGCMYLIHPLELGAPLMMTQTEISGIIIRQAHLSIVHKHIHTRMQTQTYACTYCSI